MTTEETTVRNSMNREALVNLLEHREGIHVSLFMPLEREPDKRQINLIRLKNLIRETQQQLEVLESPPPDIEQLLRPADHLLQDGLPVEHSLGLAIFLADGFSRFYRLPLPLDELTVIGKRFHVMPLLPLLSRDGRYYLLTLSQNQVQLWRGNRFSLERVDVPQLPQNMEQGLAVEEPETRSLQFHTSTNAGGDGRPAAFHGHEADKEKKGAILRYFRQVDDALQATLVGEDEPLLLAAVEYLIPIYQQANTYGHLLDERVSGNPEDVSPDELHRQSWEIIQPYVERDKEEALDRYRELANTPMTSQTLDEVLFAAISARIDTLFVPAGQQLWGRYDPATGETETCEAADIDCEDLLGAAVTNTLLHGGTVYAVEAEALPDKSAPLAAIFRYPEQ